MLNPCAIIDVSTFRYFKCQYPLMTSQLTLEIFRDFSNKCHQTVIKYTWYIGLDHSTSSKESKSTKSPVYPAKIFVLIRHEISMSDGRCVNQNDKLYSESDNFELRIKKQVLQSPKTCKHTTAEFPQPLTALEPVLHRRSYDALNGMPVR
jgi:hypothetical protein